MNSTTLIGDAYRLGRLNTETERLILQAQLFQPFTRQVFQEAGIVPGMKVLDVGSGAGDVALLLAELVGPQGQVVGVDTNPLILETARRRAREAGLTNVVFLSGDIASLKLAQDFDAVVGRWILMHLNEPAAVLRTLKDYVRLGGLVVFQETYFGTDLVSYPPSPTLQQMQEWLKPILGQQPPFRSEMGLKMYSLFQEVGLPAPQMRVDTLIGGGEEWPGYELIAETVRRLLPAIVKMGLLNLQEAQIDSLADRLRAEAVRNNSLIMLSPVVGAWARKA